MLTKTDEMRLQETIALSQEVKEFEKTLGIQPSACLSKSTMEQPGYYVYRLWIQKRGILALDTPIDMTISMSFPLTENSKSIAIKICGPIAKN